MLTFPFFFILIAYVIFLIIFFIFSGANVYHIYSTGTFTLPALAVTTLVSFVCVSILALTYVNLIGLDWNISVVLFSDLGFISFQ